MNPEEMAKEILRLKAWLWAVYYESDKPLEVEVFAAQALSGEQCDHRRAVGCAADGVEAPNPEEIRKRNGW